MLVCVKLYSIFFILCRFLFILHISVKFLLSYCVLLCLCSVLSYCCTDVVLVPWACWCFIWGAWLTNWLADVCLTDREAALPGNVTVLQKTPLAEWISVKQTVTTRIWLALAASNHSAWLTLWLTGCLPGRLAECLTHSVTHWLPGWHTVCLADFLSSFKVRKI